MAELARQIRQGFYGVEADRIQRGRDDVKVMVRYPAEERISIADLEEVRIRNRDGSEVPLPMVAEVERIRGIESIQRLNRRRTVHVRGALDDTVTDSDSVFQTLDQTILHEFE